MVATSRPATGWSSAEANGAAKAPEEETHDGYEWELVRAAEPPQCARWNRLRYGGARGRRKSQPGRVGPRRDADGLSGADRYVPARYDQDRARRHEVGDRDRPQRRPPLLRGHAQRRRRGGDEAWRRRLPMG